MTAVLLALGLMGSFPQPSGTPPGFGSQTPIGWFPLPPKLDIPPDRLRISPLDFKVVKPEVVQLPNGLRIFLMADRAVPLVNLAALMVAGTVDESSEKLGVAEATMDLMVSGGAGSLDADALDELLEFLAAQASSSAGDELSSLGLNLRSQDLDRLLPMFSDLLLRPRFQKDRVELHVSRAIESVRRRPDSPEGLAGRAAKKAVFGPNSVFAREKTEKTLRAISRKDLEAFHHRFIAPTSTVLLVTGDFQVEATVAKLQALFGRWAEVARPPRSYPPALPLARRVIWVPKQTPQSKIRIAGYGYQRLSPDEYADRVMVTALGGGIGVGRLFRQIRDQEGLAYSAWAQVYPGPTSGYFVAGADTRAEQTSRAVDAMLRVLSETAGAKPFDRSETSLAADTFLNSFAFRFDSPEKITQEKAAFALHGYPEDYLDRFRERISSVGTSSALAAAKRLLATEALQIVVVGPKDKVGDLSRFGPLTVIEDVERFQ